MESRDRYTGDEMHLGIVSGKKFACKNAGRIIAIMQDVAMRVGRR
jgi:hypothetical protein